MKQVLDAFFLKVIVRSETGTGCVLFKGYLEVKQVLDAFFLKVI